MLELLERLIFKIYSIRTSQSRIARILELEGQNLEHYSSASYSPDLECQNLECYLSLAHILGVEGLNLDCYLGTDGILELERQSLECSSRTAHI